MRELTLRDALHEAVDDLQDEQAKQDPDFDASAVKAARARVDELIGQVIELTPEDAELAACIVEEDEQFTMNTGRDPDALTRIADALRGAKRTLPSEFTAVIEQKGTGWRAGLNGEFVGEGYVSVAEAQAAVTQAMYDRFGLVPAADA